jgi:hypothetical protein
MHHYWQEHGEFKSTKRFDILILKLLYWWFFYPSWPLLLLVGWGFCLIYLLEVYSLMRKINPWFGRILVDIFYIFWISSFLSWFTMPFNGCSWGNDSLGVSEWLHTVKVDQVPGCCQLVLIFLIRDFMQWSDSIGCITTCWLDVGVSQSASHTEMGFGFCLLPLMENIPYRTLEYIPLMMIDSGWISLSSTFSPYRPTRSCKSETLGPFSLHFNGPQMYLRYHVRNLPGNPSVDLISDFSSLWDFFV